MIMLKTILRASLLLLLVSQPLSAVEQRQAPDVEHFGDWGRQCNNTPSGEELCFVFQNFHMEDTKQRMMSVRVFYPKDQKQPSISVTLPLGALLPAGAAMMMNDTELVKMMFLACSQEGCTTAATPLTDDVINAMQKGVEVLVHFAALNQKVIAMPVSLMGFTRALNSIAP